MQEILSSREILQKTERLAHQIIEHSYEEPSILIGGIKGSGSILAKKIATIIQENSDIKVNYFDLEINKETPLSSPISLSIEQSDYENQFIILIDDVLNSGKTMLYAITELLKTPVKAIKTVALVDRKHRCYPIKADFVGLRLSTTLKEHVRIDLTDGKEKAYLE